MSISEPVDFANDEVILGESVNGHSVDFSRCDIEQVEAHGGIFGANFGVTQLKLARIDWGNLGVVHVVGDAKCTDAGLVEAQEGDLLAVRAVPQGIAVAENLLLVNPVRNGIEPVWATILGDLGNVAVVPDVEVVVLDKSNLRR
jgi:hypothetical protein